MRAYRDQMEKQIVIINREFWCGFLVCFILWFLLVGCHYSTFFVGNNSVASFNSNTNSFISGNSNETTSPLSIPKNEDNQVNSSKPLVEHSTKTFSQQPELDSCSGQYIYVHEIPRRFNDEILNNCSSLNKWVDMCQSILNMGLGPQAVNSHGILQNKSWFVTNQFVLEIIFRNRMRQYKCLTNDSSRASAIYVPFYAGLDIGRYLWGFNTSVRDSASLDLIKWLTEKPEWKNLWGRDHFFVAGRVTWDFRREDDKDSDWGNKLLSMPEAKNMTMLTIESSPWSSKDFAIPYPTYFHPSTDRQVFQWQNKMRRQKRSYLFSFVGAPRPNLQDSIRGKIIKQCLASRRKCNLLDCNSNNCNNAVYVMKMFRSSIFCLQPPGDSYTRRSAFDSILAGCIPVFFHPGSAYVQYMWHLPKNYTKYSVFIPENGIKEGKADIEKILHGIPRNEVVSMREEVIRLIPRVIYADPRSRLEKIEDAFDIAVKEVLQRIENIRKQLKEGRSSGVEFGEENSWKYYLSGTVGEHQWDSFFSKTDITNSSGEK